MHVGASPGVDQDKQLAEVTEALEVLTVSPGAEGLDGRMAKAMVVRATTAYASDDKPPSTVQKVRAKASSKMEAKDRNGSTSVKRLPRTMTTPWQSGMVKRPTRKNRNEMSSRKRMKVSTALAGGGAKACLAGAPC